jgi:hypothetical protein
MIGSGPYPYHLPAQTGVSPILGRRDLPILWGVDTHSLRRPLSGDRRRALTWESPIGIEPMTYSLRGRATICLPWVATFLPPRRVTRHTASGRPR